MKTQNKQKNLKQGFTLLELLVVVLIIGILAAIALPQYKKAVEKTKVTEALLNMKAIEESMQRYILANGYPQSGSVLFEDFADIELSGGEWEYDGMGYYAKNFEYGPSITSGYYYMEVYERNDKYAFVINSNPEEDHYQCFTQDNDIGRYICKHLEPRGWKYIDSGL